MAPRCDAVFEVRAPLLVRLARAKARDGLGIRAALDRIRRQRSFWLLRDRVGRPVLFIRNGGGRKALEGRLERALDRLGRIAAEGVAGSAASA
jgi:dephospho-CoA kinase